ncbi:MAG: hypothetical protein JOZ81_06455 [Chloroflexi bacterium]|nr:hypothetical protein [Chloroflexota bacterium]MBV9542834.1 hypothetical protein [Chloroflexota bacterium]
MNVVSERVVAEVKCHLCGRMAGSLESQRSPAVRGVVFRPRANGQPVRLVNWAGLRCDDCGGTLYLDQVETVRERTEPSPEQLWGGAEPRRRRPSPDRFN